MVPNNYIICLVAFLIVSVGIGVYNYVKYCKDCTPNENKFYDTVFWLLTGVGVFECVIFAFLWNLVIKQ